MAFPDVTVERVKHWAEQRSLTYEIDNDGDVKVPFDDVFIFIHCPENLLRVQGYWLTNFDPAEDFLRVQEVANEINSRTLLPKTIVVKERGTVIFEAAEYTGVGFNDEQLHNYLDNVFTAMLKTAEELQAHVPDLAEKGNN